MPDVTITVPPAHVARVTEALCVTAGKSPVTPENARQALIDIARKITVDYWAKKDKAAAIAALAPQTDPSIT